MDGVLRNREKNYRFEYEDFDTFKKLLILRNSPLI